MIPTGRCPAGATTYTATMCRSIKTLRGAEPVTEDEMRAAALQFVRKVSGYRAPSAANRDAFEAAVEEVTSSTRHLLERLPASRVAAGS